MKITIYCDGSCNNHTGNKGGYGVVMICGESVRQFFGGSYMSTTSARMELLGSIRALEKCSPGDEVEVYCDNQYVVNSIAKRWIFKWEKERWRGRKNADLLKLVLEQYYRLESKVEFKWIRGHNGAEWNELADDLAYRGANRSKKIQDTKQK